MEEQDKYNTKASGQFAPEAEYWMSVYDYDTVQPIKGYETMGFLSVSDAWEMFRNLFDSNALAVVRHKTGIPETTFKL